MTITIQLPETLRERAATAGISDADLSRLVTDAAVKAVSDASLPDEPRRSIMDFAGVGEGRPGAVVGDAQAYINAMRNEWSHREQQPENPAP